MINVVIILWQGIIEDVKAFNKEADAFEFFKQETGVSYEEYKSRIQEEDTETILGHYAGSNIYEVKVE
jgi:hypothetical protein